MQTISARCCIAGGGPAGMMAGLLLARAGIDVLVIEKHADFFRDFRGDTIHPSTLQMLDEAGLLEEFLKRPHDELSYLAGQVGSSLVRIADFSHLPTACKFIAFMPQWDFLSFLREQGERYSTFRLMLQTELHDLIYDGGRICGVRANTPDGEIEIRCDLLLGTDGRASVVRERAGLRIRNLGAPMDVLWMRLPKGPELRQPTFGFAGAGHILVLIDRKDYYQAGLVIAKGAYQELRAQPIQKLHAAMIALAPFLATAVNAIGSWDDVRFLEVRLDRLKRWYAPGVLCIGDAAHAMSPIGGVGINLAIQDAVAAANLLWRPLNSGPPNLSDLYAVQARRMFPTRATQTVQFLLQSLVVRAVLQAKAITRPPLPLRMLLSIPAMRRLIGRLIGLGFRPEHIQSPIRAQSSQ